ncbi:outer membrane beta-barrel protein [uncultured Legionella sp.]|uniref:outer membrane beta-barrel protein n=1 Tax=uncultured Legionella sp. TaxID=210934 RepID=UPI00260FD477|nr:outer membrane beta-barrel protein [uncultured Legionella sp.]
MSKKLLPLFLLVSLFFMVVNCNAGTTGTAPPHHSFYAGALGGFGSTTWKGLVPTKENQNMALILSTPIEVTEGGGVWGLFTGYEFSPYFAIEASYIRYPEAKVFFDSMSLFSFNNDGKIELHTKTETVNLMGKIMLQIPNSKIRVYSSAGIADVHRDDFLINQWLISPTFGAGLNYRLTDHLMTELGANYTAGFGESQLEPTSSYIPFLYSVSIRVAYLF